LYRQPKRAERQKERRQTDGHNTVAQAGALWGAAYKIGSRYGSD